MQNEILKKVPKHGSNEFLKKYPEKVRRKGSLAGLGEDLFGVEKKKINEIVV